MQAGKVSEVVLGVTGSIAAYKAAELVRLLVQAELGVSVVMTQGATQFVGKLTFQTLSRRSVAVDMFEEPAEWVPGHIALAERAAVMVVAPCTANVLAKLAHGLADDMLTATALACAAPLLVAPAMNVRMWDHPATQANVATLRARGVTLLEVGTGDLACGYEGRGRMAEPAQILAAIRQIIDASAGVA
jgi:phosphopantothenoylcysteine decarboxylase/phosphopantothenate--cysteine ligase